LFARRGEYVISPYKRKETGFILMIGGGFHTRPL